MEQRTKKDLLNTPYQYIGTYINKLCLTKKQDSKIEKIKLSFDGYMFDVNSQKFVIGVEVSLDFNDSKDNSILFVSGFKISGEEEIKDLISLNETVDESKNLVLEKWLPVLMRTIYPFIRERIFQLTIDLNEPIMLPIMDISLITRVNEAIELYTEE